MGPRVIGFGTSRSPIVPAKSPLRVIRVGHAQNSSRSSGTNSALQKNLHVLKVKSDGVGLEEIVADHAREVKTKGIFPRERSIVQTRHVFFLYFSEGKLMHGIWHDF